MLYRNDCFKPRVTGCTLNLQDRIASLRFCVRQICFARKPFTCKQERVFLFVCKELATGICDWTRFCSRTYLIKTAENCRKEDNMKKRVICMLAVMVSTCCLVGCGGSEKPQEQTSTVTQESTTKVEKETTTKAENTTTAEKESTVEIAETGAEVTELTDGTYSIDVESSSSMFKIEKAELTVEAGEMTAVITLSGTGYGKLYMGTEEAAATAEEAACITFVEDANGTYTYTIPVEALDQPIECAAYSNKKEQWYGRQLTFLSASISSSVEEEIAVETTVADENAKENAAVEVTDGTYSIDVTLGGGSGRTTVVSPATITITGDAMVARIEWTSPNYDYMLVNGEKFLPVNTEGNSVFEIPVAELDAEFAVIGDTVAMSKPREIEYTLTFHSDSIKAAE